MLHGIEARGNHILRNFVRFLRIIVFFLDSVFIETPFASAELLSLSFESGILGLLQKQVINKAIIYLSSHPLGILFILCLATFILFRLYSDVVHLNLFTRFVHICIDVVRFGIGVLVTLFHVIKTFALHFIEEVMDLFEPFFLVNIQSWERFGLTWYLAEFFVVIH